MSRHPKAGSHAAALKDIWQRHRTRVSATERGGGFVWCVASESIFYRQVAARVEGREEAIGFKIFK